MPLTSSDNYFEDFAVGQTFEHVRGKTLTEMDQVLISHLVMNSAQAHFNEVHATKSGTWTGRIAFGGVTISMILGLASQDTIENAVAVIGLDKVRLMKSVYHGDTFMAFSEVLSVADGPRPDCGEVVFKHWGVNQNDDIVMSAERRVLIKRRPGQ